MPCLKCYFHTLPNKIVFKRQYCYTFQIGWKVTNNLSIQICVSEVSCVGLIFRTVEAAVLIDFKWNCRYLAPVKISPFLFRHQSFRQGLFFSFHRELHDLGISWIQRHNLKKCENFEEI